MIMGGSDGSPGLTSIRDGQTIERSESLPTVDEVLARYEKAMGGAEAIKAVNSRVMKGTLDVVGVSRGGSFEIYAVAPNKMLSVMDAHPLGNMKIGYNGRTGWELAERVVRRINGTELESLQRDGDFYYQLNLKQNFKKVSLLGKSSIGYREVYVLELQPRSGSPAKSTRVRPGTPAEDLDAVKLYLDVETYLPVRMNSVRMVSVAGGVWTSAHSLARGAGLDGRQPRPRHRPLRKSQCRWRFISTTGAQSMAFKYPFRISQSSRWARVLEM